MFLFFDLDGTLVDHDHAARTASRAFREHFAAALPYSAEEFPAVWDEILNKHFDRFCRGEVSFDEHRRERMRELFQDPTMPAEIADTRYRVYYDQYTKNWRLFEDVLPCLSRFYSEPLGVISNGHPEEQLRKLKKTGIAPNFTVTAISGEVGCAKPKPEIFLEACRRANVNPKDCIYVGDSWEFDVVGSRAAGMKAVWLNRKGKPTPDSSIRMITSLHQLHESCG